MYATIELSPGARVRLRDRGAGPAVLLLHGGWGYGAYPFDRQLEALAAAGYRAIAPDRVGYGGSGRRAGLPDGFHVEMARETIAVLDALGLERAALWGHSDGAVVAAWAAILAPARVPALVLEALHFFRAKPASLEFFRTGAEAPERFGEQVLAALEADHGTSWRDVVGHGARAWLRIIEGGLAEGGDLFAGRLGEIRAPALLLHGRRDPRTEPGEVEAALAALAAARVEWLDAGHSPHTSAAAAGRATETALAFLAGAAR